MPDHTLFCFQKVVSKPSVNASDDEGVSFLLDNGANTGNTSAAIGAHADEVTPSRVIQCYCAKHLSRADASG